MPGCKNGGWSIEMGHRCKEVCPAIIAEGSGEVGGASQHMGRGFRGLEAEGAVRGGCNGLLMGSGVSVPEIVNVFGDG